VYALIDQYLEGAVAVIGAGCRYPGGVRDPASFWQLLQARRVAVGRPPPDRWDPARFLDPDPDTPGYLYVQEGAFLEGPIDRFDAAAFGISPREAAAMDPQQRMILEVAAEALENAGIAPRSLAGGRVGVYCGAMSTDYQGLMMRPANSYLADTHTALGMTLGVIANRVSHALDLRGPSLCIDTACSASLTALHYARRDVLAGEVDMALCGGVNLMLLPEFITALCRGRFLGPGGRSRPFEAGAEGYGRGEGAGVVVLKPARAALADGDPIFGFLLASGVNQDGRTEGMSRPSAAAQIDLLREVYARAGLSPAEVSHVEAHGTGTVAGDTIEAEALGAVFGAARDPEDPLLVGTLKGNIGHQEAGAGLAALIKTLLTLRHGVLPGHPGLERPNPAIDFRALNIVASPWEEPLPDRPAGRFAGISAFGYGGTNAHVVVGAPPPPRPRTARRPRLQVLMLSAPDTEGLRLAAQAHRDHLRAGETALADQALAAAALRPRRACGLVAIAETAQDMADRLDTYAEGAEEVPGILSARTEGSGEERPVLVFTGMGTQYHGMTRGLMEYEPVFAQALRETDEIFQDRWSLSPLALLADETRDPGAFDRAQLTNFLVQVALCHLLTHWGVRPAAVVGHSAGEVVAAWRAGVLTLEEAASVVHHRARLMQPLAGQGGMLVTALPPEEAMARAEAHGPLDLAAVNAPRLTTLAGPRDAVEGMVAALKAEGLFVRQLAVDQPYHSRAMAVITGPFAAALADLAPQPPRLPWVSSVAADVPPAGDGAYWAANLRQPVRFDQAIDRLLDQGERIFLQVGPHPTLSSAIRDLAAHHSQRVICLGSLHRDIPPPLALAELKAGLFLHGLAADWARVHSDGQRVQGALPPPTWAETRFFTESEASHQQRLGRAPHPLLGDRQVGPGGQWVATLSATRPAFLGGHQVRGRVILPAAVHLEILLAAAEAIHGDGPVRLDGIHFPGPLAFEGKTPVHLATRLEEDGRARVESTAFPAHAASAWRRHAEARVVPLPALRGGPPPQDAWAGLTPRAVADFYVVLAGVGLSYDGSFRGIETLATDGKQAMARLAAPPEGMRLHPGLLDSALQAALAILPEPRLLLPRSLEALTLLAAPGGPVTARIRARSESTDGLMVDIDLWNAEGAALARLEGLSYAVPPASLREGGDLDLFHPVWRPVASFTADPGVPWILAQDGPTEAALAMAPAGTRALPLASAPDAVAAGAERILLHLDSDRIDPRAATALLIATARAFGEGPGRVLVATRDAQAVVSGDKAAGHGLQAVWGAGRALRLECPTLAIGLVDLPAAPGRKAMALLWSLGTDQAPQEAAIRGGEILRRELARISAEEIDALGTRPHTPSPNRPIHLDLGSRAPVWRLAPPLAEPDSVPQIEVLSPAPGFPGWHDAILVWPGADGTPGLGPRRVVSGGTTLLTSHPGAQDIADLISVPFAGEYPPPLTALSRMEAILRRLPTKAPVVLDLPPGPTRDSLADHCRAQGHPVTLIIGADESAPDVPHLAGDHLETRTVVLDLVALQGVFVPLTLEGSWLAGSLAARPGTVAALADQTGVAPRSLAVPPPLERPAHPPFPTRAELTPGVTAVPLALYPNRPGIPVRPARLAPAMGSETTVITGGLAGVGAELARCLAARGHPALALLGRRGADTPKASALKAELEALGARVLIHAVDVTDRAALQLALSKTRTTLGSPGLVIHAAGAVISAPLAETDAALINTAWAAKVAGAVNLEALTRSDPLRGLVVIGSLAGMAGNRRQTAYAAANAALEGLASHWRVRGRPALAVVPGALEGAGSVAADAALAERLRLTGMTPLPVTALADRLLLLTRCDALAVAGLARVDWDLWPGATDPRSPLFALAVKAGGRAGIAAESPLDAAALAGMLTRVIAAEVGATPASMDRTKPLGTFGMDSLMALVVATDLEAMGGPRCDPLDILSAHSIDALAEFLAARPTDPSALEA